MKIDIAKLIHGKERKITKKFVSQLNNDLHKAIDPKMATLEIAAMKSLKGAYELWVC